MYDLFNARLICVSIFNGILKNIENYNRMGKTVFVNRYLIMMVTFSKHF